MLGIEDDISLPVSYFASVFHVSPVLTVHVRRYTLPQVKGGCFAPRGLRRTGIPTARTKHWGSWEICTISSVRFVRGEAWKSRYRYG